MRTLTKFLLLSLAGLFPLYLDATTYYVAKNGNDASSGTIDSPWYSLQRASSGLRPGDLVLVRSGVYHERFLPSQSGDADAPIVYRAYPGEYVEIDGSPAGELNVVSIYSNNIVMDGFTITNQNYFRSPGQTTYWVALEGRNITFRKNRVFTSGDVWNNIYAKNAMSRGIVVGGNSNTVEQCYVRGQVFGIVLAGPSPRNTIIRQDTVHAVGQNHIDVTSTEDGSTAYHNTLIEYCVLDTSLVEDNIQFEPNYADKGSTLYNRGTIIRYNRMGNAAENGIDLKGAGHTIIEHNVIYSSNGDDDGPLNGPDAGSGTGIETETADSPTRYTIVRNNLIYDHNSGATLAEGDHYYNNTILNNRRTWQGPNQTDSRHTGVRAWNMPNSKRAFVNNIVGGMPNGSMVEFLMDWGGNFTIDHNLYYESSGTAPFSHRVNGSVLITRGVDAWKSILATAGGYAYMQGKEQHSLEANPLFVNGVDYPTGFDPTGDFRLQSTSPAIDAGTPLTTAVQAGNASTSLVVDDAYFFCNGFGRVEGDLIVIGTAAPVRILSIDYSSNVLSLDGPRTWSAGAGVALAYSGSAPDIGAYEFNHSTPPGQSPSRPSPPEFVSPANGSTVIATRVRVTWMNIAGAESYVVQLARDSLFTSKLLDTTVKDVAIEIGPLDGGTRYYRRIRARSPAGESEFGSVTSFSTGTPKGEGSIPEEAPAAYALSQNYPNPFNPTTALSYAVPGQTHVSLRVYNLLGAEVAVLVDREQAAGVYEVRFDASALPSGVYFYRLETGEFHETKRMTLVR